MNNVLSTHANHARIFREEYLRVKVPEIFDTVDHEYARRKGPRYDQSRAYNEALYTSIAIGLDGQKAVYCAGSISKGMLANAWISNELPVTVKVNDGSLIKARHVYDLDETIGSQNFTEILRKNKRIQLQKLNLLQALMPERIALAPIALQGAISVAGSPNFDQGSKRRDKDFMQVWTPVIRELCDTFFVAGDWFFSGATSGLEYPEAIAIAAGLRRRRSKSDMRFIDMNNKDVSLFEMSRRYAEFILWAAEQNDFYLKYEPTALMRNFAIATMAQRGQLPNANPIFLDGILSQLRDMRELQRCMEPLILDRVRAGFFEMDVSDLEKTAPHFVAKYSKIKEGARTSPQVSIDHAIRNLTKSGISLHRFTKSELEQGDFELKEIAAVIPRQDYLSLTENVAINRAVRPVDMRGEAVNAFDGLSLFSRELLPLTTERERLLASLMVGALETSSPSSTKRLFYIMSDDKYGEATEKIQRDSQLSHGDEVPSVLGRNFSKVRQGNREAIITLKNEMTAEGKHVLSSLDFQEQAAVVAQNSRIVVAPGEAKLSSAARTHIRHTFMMRNITDFCFPMGGWEMSTDGAQDMILATRMQLGLQAGSAIQPQQVRVFDEKRQCLTIADRAKAIWSPLKVAFDNGRSAQDLEETATALVQLWALHRLSSDHTMRLRVFEKMGGKEPSLVVPNDFAWDCISPFIFAYDHRDFEELFQREIMPSIESTMIMAVRLRHLDYIDDFVAMRARQEARLRIAVAGTLDARSFRRRQGGAVPQLS